MINRWAKRPNEDPIDFPVSWDFHRFYEVENNRPDPGPAYPDQRYEPKTIDTKPQPVVLEIHKLQVLVVELQNRLNQHIDRSKKSDRL
jgi:hypothetical protein